MGAWIETRVSPDFWVMVTVAPHVGAWIETWISKVIGLCLRTSHPMWVRGLKQPYRITAKRIFMSHPMWVRGLKLEEEVHKRNDYVSHPMWVRGLKHIDPQKAAEIQASHPMWVRGLKLLTKVPTIGLSRRTPCGCVD